MPESQIGQFAASNHLISFESLVHINVVGSEDESKHEKNSTYIPNYSKIEEMFLLFCLLCF